MQPLVRRLRTRLARPGAPGLNWASDKHRTMTRKNLATAGLLLGLVTSLTNFSPHAAAQAPRREPTPNDTLKSPEVLPDNRVAFRIYAPKASEVSLCGDWVAQGL